MAAPAEISVRDLSGKWESNLSLSDDVTPVMELQGVSMPVRLAIASAPISISITQTTEGGVAKIVSTQGTLGQTNEETRILNWGPLEQPHVIFGNLTIKARFAQPDAVDEALRSGWDGEVIEMQVDANDWTSSQVWGFIAVDGAKRHVRRSIVKKGGESKVVQLVYDYAGSN